MQVFEQMIDQIVKGAWKPGDKIPSENELTQMMGVSRISVREAIQKLAALDLLETRQGVGTFVKALSGSSYMSFLVPLVLLSKDDILHVLEYRRIVEAGIVEMVIDRADENDINNLHLVIRKMAESQNDLKKFTVYDLDFHLTLAKITRNPIIIKINSMMTDALISSMSSTIQLPGAVTGLHYHELIVEAIENKDKAKAREYTQKLIDDVIQCVG